MATATARARFLSLAVQACLNGECKRVPIRTRSPQITVRARSWGNLPIDVSVPLLRAAAGRKHPLGGMTNIGLIHCSRDFSPFEASRSAMIHPRKFRDGPMKDDGPDPLQDALELRAHVKGLRALLEFQRWQIEVLNDRLYASASGGTAARRLLALKQSEAGTSRSWRDSGSLAHRADPAGRARKK